MFFIKSSSLEVYSLEEVRRFLGIFQAPIRVGKTHYVVLRKLFIEIFIKKKYGESSKIIKITIGDYEYDIDNYTMNNSMYNGEDVHVIIIKEIEIEKIPTTIITQYKEITDKWDTKFWNDTLLSDDKDKIYLKEESSDYKLKKFISIDSPKFYKRCEQLVTLDTKPEDKVKAKNLSHNLLRYGLGLEETTLTGK